MPGRLSFPNLIDEEHSDGSNGSDGSDNLSAEDTSLDIHEPPPLYIGAAQDLPPPSIAQGQNLNVGNRNIGLLRQESQYHGAARLLHSHPDTVFVQSQNQFFNTVLAQAHEYSSEPMLSQLQNQYASIVFPYILETIDITSFGSVSMLERNPFSPLYEVRPQALRFRSIAPAPASPME